MLVATPNHPTGFETRAGTISHGKIFDSLKRALERIPKVKHSGRNRVCLMNTISNADAAKKKTK